MTIPWTLSLRCRFGGDPAPNSTTNANAHQEPSPSVIEQVKLRAAETAKSFMIDMWLARQTPEKVLPLLLKVIEGVKDEFADAIANGGVIYAVGYCFGAKYVLLLAGEQLDTGSQSKASKDEEHAVAQTAPVIKAGAMAHGQFSKSGLQGLILSASCRNSRDEGGYRRCSIASHDGLRWLVSGGANVFLPAKTLPQKTISFSLTKFVSKVANIYKPKVLNMK